MVYVPRIVVGASEHLGINGALGVDLIDLVLTTARWTAYPIGAALIGAVIVIETLRPTSRAPTDENDEEESHNRN